MALAERGQHEVCVVDLDLAFGDVAVALGLLPVRTIADAVPMADLLDEPTLNSLLTTHSPGVKTLAALLEPGLSESIPADLVTRVLGLLKQQFYVPGGRHAARVHGSRARDLRPDRRPGPHRDAGHPRAQEPQADAGDAATLNYPRERWRVVVNRSDSKVGLLLSEVEKSLRMPIAGQIPSAREVPASINRGVPIVLDDAKIPSARRFAPSPSSKRWRP